ncbi:hypothetical protein [Apilactobacillus timberlakei]|uniref:hypothetical protein n=1 Tax=Apilactobacillus timberlakei TaxID=2008380 RepID=UPI001127969B|nr:hypothetical protein [Apilactobacillus timberlakei]TPR16692.1 hypothetical protein DYZ95_07570 [Apilactobacillus timberlakei]
MDNNDLQKNISELQKKYQEQEFDILKSQIYIAVGLVIAFIIGYIGINDVGVADNTVYFYFLGTTLTITIGYLSNLKFERILTLKFQDIICDIVKSLVFLVLTYFLTKNKLCIFFFMNNSEYILFRMFVESLPILLIIIDFLYLFITYWYRYKKNKNDSTIVGVEPTLITIDSMMEKECFKNDTASIEILSSMKSRFEELDKFSKKPSFTNYEVRNYYKETIAAMENFDFMKERFDYIERKYNQRINNKENYSKLYKSYLSKK